MPERQSTPGRATAERDAEAPPGNEPTSPPEPAMAGIADAPTRDMPIRVDGERVAGPDDGRPDDTPTVVTESPTLEASSGTPDPDAAATQVMSSSPTTSGGADSPTVNIAVARSDAPPPGTPPPAVARRLRKRALLIVGGVVAAFALLYGGDLLLSSGSVPRGVTVEGVPIGGLALADAEQTLRARIEPRTTQSLPVTVGDAKTTIDPRTAGLSVDWPATIARAGAQPLNPITRITSLFSSRETGVVTRSDRAALQSALTELKPTVDKPVVEGNIRFDGVTPQPVQPASGQQLDVPAAADVLERDWASGATTALPMMRVDPISTTDDVTGALEKVAKPAVSAPVTITGENNTEATLTPSNIAAALSFRPDPAAGLVPELNQDALSAVLKPQLADSETPGRDATLDFTGPTPVVVPSQDGRGVDYPATVAALLPVLSGTGPRQLAAVYAPQPAKLTTEGLAKLGIAGIIGEFTTHGFAADSGMNIKRAADQINGAIVLPGATFSLNAATNPRDAAHGYVEAGIIEDGHPARGIGGGVSQVATTLYNASYFAGMTNVEHREHSFYISRYPAGREATVFDNVIDVKFRNDNPGAVMIQTVWAPGSITVRIYGTKRYDVTSTAGPRTNPTEPKTVSLPADQPGQPCTPSKGAPGFTITDTRTLREISTGQVRTETRTVHYNPSPIVVCGDPDQ